MRRLEGSGGSAHGRQAQRRRSHREEDE
ncbi:MAG: hypothetical protein QOC59_947, partial [Microbacteriaceae bacterium]|nr:hypothetical protein [Microbacteriaceae bacterium]